MASFVWNLRWFRLIGGTCLLVELAYWWSFIGGGCASNLATMSSFLSETKTPRLWEESVMALKGHRQAGLHKIIFFRYPIWNVPWKCVNLYCMNSWQKEKQQIMFTIIFSSYFFLSTCFRDRSFFLWKKLLWVAEICFCDRNCLFVTEVCFFDGNSDQNLFLWWKFFF